MNTLGIVQVWAALGAGFLSFFSPCTLPVLPVYVAYLASDAHGEGQASFGRRLLAGIAFVLGLSCVFVTLGFGAGALGRVVGGTVFAAVCGVIVMWMGVYMTGIVHIPLFERDWRPGLERLRGNGGIARAFLLGLAFSFGWTPCVGPVLASVLALAAGSGGSAVGAILLAVYSLGLGVPFVVLSAASELLTTRVKAIQRYAPQIKAVGGSLIAVLGLWMVISSVQGQISRDVAQVMPPAADERAVEEQDGGASPKAGMFVLRRLEDDSVTSLADYAGRPVVLKVWGTWCPPCMEGLSAYQDFAQETNESGKAAVLSVVIPGQFGEKFEEDFERWYASEGMTLPVLFDDGSFVQGQGIRAFPTYLFYDAEGNYVGGRVGDMEPEAIRETLAGISDGSIKA